MRQVVFSDQLRTDTMAYFAPGAARRAHAYVPFLTSFCAGCSQ